MFPRRLFQFVASVASITLFSAMTAPAGSIAYQATPSGGNAPAVASFTTYAGGITVTLVNDDVNPGSVAENVSALRFDVSTGNGGAGSSLSSSSGTPRTVAGDGTFSDGSPVPTGWAFGTSGGMTISLDVLSGGASGPAHTLLGLPDSGGSYSNAKGSIAGNGPHNPFLADTITFNIIDPAATDFSMITNVNIQFGTTDGSNLVPGIDSPPSVPEPASVVMAGIGLTSVLGYCVLDRRRRKRLKTTG
jgi:hypothetical protein